MHGCALLSVVVLFGKRCLGGARPARLEQDDKRRQKITYLFLLLELFFCYAYNENTDNRRFHTRCVTDILTTLRVSM